MSDQTENQWTGRDLDALKEQAVQMGIKHHPAMGAKKLQALIEKHQAGEIPVEVHQQDVQTMSVSEITELQQLRAEKLEREAEAERTAKPKESTGQKRTRLIEEASKLIRIRVSCMSPNKRDWEGEMYTVSNSVVGTHKKYVPFNNDEGWHVPNIIVKHMKEKKCQIFYTKKDNRGNKTRHGKLINELNVEIMDPLTVPELKELAQRQAMARGETA